MSGKEEQEAVLSRNVREVKRNANSKEEKKRSVCSKEVKYRKFTVVNSKKKDS